MDRQILGRAIFHWISVDSVSFVPECRSLMRRALPVLLGTAPDVSEAVLPSVLLLTTCVSNLSNQHSHPLFLTSLSWFATWLYCVSRTGLLAGLQHDGAPGYRFAVGGLVALSCLCERAAAVGDRFWWTKVMPLSCSGTREFETDPIAKSFCPVLIVLLSRTGANFDETIRASDDGQSAKGYGRSGRAAIFMTTIATAFSLPVLAGNYNSPQVAVLGLCCTLATTCACILFERTVRQQEDEKHPTSGSLMAANGSLVQSDNEPQSREGCLEATRDVAGTVLLICGFSMIYFHIGHARSITFSGSYSSIFTHDWKIRQQGGKIGLLLTKTMVEVLRNILWAKTVCSHFPGDFYYFKLTGESAV